jgi:hypothetical protein
MPTADIPGAQRFYQKPILDILYHIPLPVVLPVADKFFPEKNRTPVTGDSRVKGVGEIKDTGCEGKL